MTLQVLAFERFLQFSGFALPAPSSLLNPISLPSQASAWRLLQELHSELRLNVPKPGLPKMPEVHAVPMQGLAIYRLEDAGFRVQGLYLG